MENTLYQVATLQSLLMGNYYGSVPYDELLKLADTGIGTFEGMDGEMIAFDGVVYRADVNGHVTKADTSIAAPYCCMAQFRAEHSCEIGACTDFEALCAALDAAIPANQRNIFHMAKIEGEFDTVAMRSVAGSTPPYKITGSHVEPNQKCYALEQTRGLAVALRCPDYMDRLNMPGWHLHYITDDRSIAGHVTGLTVRQAKADFCSISRFEMMLPRDEAFGSLELLNISNDAVRAMES